MSLDLDLEKEKKRLRTNYESERDAAVLYHALADGERNQQRADLLRHLAQAEERHSEIWAGKLRALGEEPRAGERGFAVRAIMLLARVFGGQSVLPLIKGIELRGTETYADQPDAQALIPEEQLHAKTFARMTSESKPVDIASSERWHRGGGGGALRAAVFGVNDGLVSNLSLVVGVAGAEPGREFILLAGVAGLLAGAFSMAAGEYISMRSQRELFEQQLALERMELQVNPEEEFEELSIIYQLKGIPKDEAERIAQRVASDPQTALDTMAREELGLDPNELGSPWGAAISSFIAFTLGAAVPVLPYFFGSGAISFWLSAGLSALALFGVGGILSLFTGRNPWYSGGRMLLIGAAAATITFSIGRLIGVSISG